MGCSKCCACLVTKRAAEDEDVDVDVDVWVKVRVRMKKAGEECEDFESLPGRGCTKKIGKARFSAICQGFRRG